MKTALIQKKLNQRSLPFTLYLILILMCLVTAGFTAPYKLVQSVTRNGVTITMQLTQVDLRGSHFELWSQNSTGSYDVMAAGEERSYLGTVDEFPDALSCGIMQDNGIFRGVVFFDRGVSWYTLDDDVVSTRALNYENFTDYKLPTAPTVQAGQVGTDTYGFDVGIDANYSFYTGVNSNVISAFEAIEFSVNAVRAVYLQNALLRPYLGRVIIRTSQGTNPYNGMTAMNTMLDRLKSEWNSNHSDADKDVVAGIFPEINGAGLAWVGVIASSNAYSVNGSDGSQKFDHVWRHEMGHNWGNGHYTGGSPEGRSIMSGNDPGRFSGSELYVNLVERDKKLSSLDNNGIFTTVNLPPYAALDAPEIVYVRSTSHEHYIDVLANDVDANNDKLTVVSTDATSNQGVPVKVAAGISSEGRTVISYTTNLTGYTGLDWFHYVAQDEQGKKATGVVTVNLGTTTSSLNTLSTSATNGTISLDPLARSYATGTVVTVTAFPDKNYTFSNWSGDVSGSGITQTITMNGDKSITANFEAAAGIDPLAGQKLLHRIYPNPFTDFLNIDFEVPASNVGNGGVVSINIYNIQGRSVAKIVEKSFTPGKHNLHYKVNNTRIKPGVYYIQINTGRFKHRQKIIKG